MVSGLAAMTVSLLQRTGKAEAGKKDCSMYYSSSLSLSPSSSPNTSYPATEPLHWPFLLQRMLFPAVLHGSLPLYLSGIFSGKPPWDTPIDSLSFSCFTFLPSINCTSEHESLTGLLFASSHQASTPLGKDFCLGQYAVSSVISICITYRRYSNICKKEGKEEMNREKKDIKKGQGIFFAPKLSS